MAVRVKKIGVCGKGNVEVPIVSVAMVAARRAVDRREPVQRRRHALAARHARPRPHALAQAPARPPHACAHVPWTLDSLPSSFHLQPFMGISFENANPNSNDSKAKNL